MIRTVQTARVGGPGIEALTEWGRQALAGFGEPDPAAKAEVPTVATGPLWHGLKQAFATLTNDGENFALMPCSVNGQPAGLIVCFRALSKGIEVAPMFVSLTPGMTVTDPEGDILYGGDDPA